jgi:hypothetical protein
VCPFRIVIVLAALVGARVALAQTVQLPAVGALSHVPVEFQFPLATVRKQSLAKLSMNVVRAVKPDV